MFGHLEAQQKELNEAVKTALSISIKYSNEAQVLVDAEGVILFKNTLCKFDPKLEKLPLPKRPFETNSLYQYQEQVIRVLSINEDLILLKPLPPSFCKPVTSTESESESDLTGTANKQAFEVALAKAEQIKKNRLLVILQITINGQAPSNLLNTIAKLLTGCWRSADNIFYLGSNKFAVLYNNAPDMELVTLRLASIHNILNYKGYKGIEMQIGHSTLELANMQSETLVKLAHKDLLEQQSN